MSRLLTPADHNDVNKDLQTKQILFDCDNTLVLSEELAFEACADLANEILAKQGISERYVGEQLIIEFVGQNFRGMTKSLEKKFNFTLPPEELGVYLAKEEEAVIAKLEAKGKPCLGAMEVLEKLYKEKHYGLAVVSSSALRRVRASIKKVDQDRFFPYEHIYSAATSLPKPTTKPDPAIYNYAMEQLGVKPEECVAVEDSKSGATAAVRARIPCIAYVGAYNGRAKQDEVAKTLTNLGCKKTMYHWVEFENLIKELQVEASVE